MKGINMYMGSLFGNFGNLSISIRVGISIRIYFFVCQICNHQKIPIRNFRCVEGALLVKSTEVTRMEREKESSELSRSRVELFVRLQVFWLIFEGSHLRRERVKMCHQRLLAENNSRKEVPTNSYGLDDIGRQKKKYFKKRTWVLNWWYHSGNRSKNEHFPGNWHKDEHCH